MQYRKKNNSNTWHFCGNCSNWPASDFEIQLSKPLDKNLCSECKAKQASRNCKSVAPPPSKQKGISAKEQKHELQQKEDLRPLFPVEVVGESKYRENIEMLFGKIGKDGVNRDDLTAKLVLEDENPHDDQAVYVEIQGRKVGYLKRDDARLYRDGLIGQKTINEYRAMVNGGFQKSDGTWADFGIWLDIDLVKVRHGSSPNAPIVGEKPARKWKTWQIGAAVVAGLIFCGCAGFWALWVIAKLSGY